MKVKEIMTTPVVSVAAGTPLPEVAATLRDNRISGVPVVDGSGAVLGLVSEHDLLAGHDLLPQAGSTAGDVMTRSVISVSEDTDIDEVRQLLVQRRIHRVPVLAGPVLVGIVSRSDVAALLATEWVCQVCGEPVRGQHPPQACPKCQAGPGSFVLQDPYPGS